MQEVGKWFIRSLSPQQVCWLCLLVTVSGGMYAMRVFARTDDVASIRVELLQDRLLDLRIKQCDAIQAGQPPQFFAKYIQEQAVIYFSIVGVNPILPPCEEL